MWAVPDPQADPRASTGRRAPCCALPRSSVCCWLACSPCDMLGWRPPAGRPLTPLTRSRFFPRCGLALALNKLSQCLDSSQVKPLFQFFVPDALNDRNPDVRKCMLDAALATLNTHGKVGDLSQARRWGKGLSHPRSGEKAGLGQAAGCTMVPQRGPVLDVLAGRWPPSGFCLYFLGQKDPPKGVKLL